MELDKRNTAKNSRSLMTKNERRTIMGPYERKLMEELDAQEVAQKKKERKEKGYDYLGEGSYTRRSGVYEDNQEE